VNRKSQASNSNRLAVKSITMITEVANIVSSRQAAAAVNEWLVSYVGDRFLAGQPSLDVKADVWRIPILFLYPQEGPIGEAGEAAVDALTGEVCSRPAISEIKRRAMQLFEEKRGVSTPSISATGN
jgi:hypothetical protein